MKYPVSKPKITSKFGPRTVNGKPSNHSGTDYVSTDGNTNVYAVEAGKIERRYDSVSGYGVNLYSGNRKWEYLHLNSGVRPGNGATVEEGDKLGNYKPGSGKVTGPHLHLGLQIPHNGPQMDPHKYIDSMIKQEQNVDMYKGKTAEEWYKAFTDFADDRAFLVKKVEEMQKAISKLESESNVTKGAYEATIADLKKKLDAAGKKVEIDVGSNTQTWIESLINIFRRK